MSYKKRFMLNILTIEYLVNTIIALIVICDGILIILEGWEHLFVWFCAIAMFTLAIYSTIRLPWIQINVSQVNFIHKITIEPGEILIIYYIKDEGPYQLKISSYKNLNIEVYRVFRNFVLAGPHIEFTNKQIGLKIKFYANNYFSFKDMMEMKNSIEKALGKPKFNYDRY